MAPNTAQARMGAHRSWANTVDRAARTSAGTNAFLARFERQVDPDGTLEPAERERRALHARRAHMIELALKSAASRALTAAARASGERPEPDGAARDEIAPGEECSPPTRARSFPGVESEQVA